MSTTDFLTKARADGGFDVTVRVFQSPQFYAWLTGLAGLIRLKAPTRAVDAYRAYLTGALDGLKNEE